MSANIVKSFSGFEVKDAAKGEIRAVFATTGCKDKDDDWTLPGFIESGSEVLIGAYGHKTVLDGALPIGKGTITESGNQAILDGKIFIDASDARDTFAVLRELGPKQEWSYEFQITKTGIVTEQMRQMGVRRVIEKVRVFGVAPVMQGAGIGTQTLSAKSETADSDPFEEHFAEVAAIAKRLEDAELREIEGNVRAHAKTVVNNEVEDLFEKVRNDPKFDARPSTKQAVLVHNMRQGECARYGIPEEKRPAIRWFEGSTKFYTAIEKPHIGVYDENRNTIWLSANLSNDELIKTFGHELQHGRQCLRGWPYTEGDAERAGELLLERVKEQALYGYASYAA